MKKQHILPLALILGGSAALPLSAQTESPKRADTLRRELTVMTQEELTLSTRQPQDLSLSLPAPRVSEPRYSYEDRGLGANLLLSPLRALAPMQGGFARSEQRGYLTARGGVSTTLRLGAGYRILAQEHDELDVLGRFDWTQARLGYDVLAGQGTARQQQWLLGAHYLHRFDLPSLELGAELGRYKTNYYGRATYEQKTAPSQSPLGSQATIEDPEQATQHFRLSARLATPEIASEDWLYDLGFSLDYTSTKYTEALLQSYSYEASELAPRLSLQLSHRLSSTARLGIYGALSYYRPSYQQLSQQQALPDASRSSLSVAPYISYGDLSDEWRWDLRGGLRLTNGSDPSGAQLYLFPKIDARLSYGSAFSLRLESDAEHYAQLRGQLLSREMPYLSPTSYPELLERRSWVKLSAKTLLEDRFSAEAWVGYSSHRHAAQWRPVSMVNVYLPQGATAPLSLGFVPYYAGYQALSIGAALSYRHEGLFTASLAAEHKDYQQASDLLTGRPEWTLSALLELQSIPRTQLRAGYEFATATSSYDLAGQVVRLKPLHVLHGEAAYRVSSRFSLTAELRAQLLTGATQWYGYRQQPLTALLGLQYLF